ncbi:MAG: hypothetical protein OSJ64_00845 [Firmicutes bacterium]|nr:hypothetical protein [Bacillota bacterium]
MTYKVSADEAAALSLNESEPVAAVLQQIAVLLATKQGTVPFYREFGLLQNFLDKPVNVAKPLLYLEVKEAIERFVPQAELVNIEFKADESRPGRIEPVVEVKIKDEAE